MDQAIRNIVIRLNATQELRTASLFGREHLVVPVVMLVEGVIWPVNAEHPELVLSSEFSKAPLGWNGRPIVPDHPSDGPLKVSANTPAILERESFGQVFNTYVRDKQLGAEAWLDAGRAAAVGRTAQNVIDRVRNKQPIEVSVGILVAQEMKSGEFNGKRYDSIWREPVPDHLAMFGDETIGACSLDMGCGAMRASSSRRDRVFLTTAGGYALASEEDERMAAEGSAEKPKWKPLRDILTAASSVFRFAADEMSDVDLRQALDEALRASVPGYGGIEEVKFISKKVIYASIPADRWVFTEQNYEVNGMSITLGTEKVEVKPIQDFVPVTAAAKAAAAGNPPCGCGAGRSDGNPAVAEAAQPQGGSSMTKQERINALIASPKTAFTDADKAMLEAFPEDRLAAFESFAPPVETPTVAATTPAPAAPVVPAATPVVVPAAPVVAAAKTPEQIEADYLANAPESIRLMVAENKQRTANEKLVLITKLKTAQTAFTEDELKTMSNEHLRKMAAALKLDAAPQNTGIDYSAMVGASVSTQPNDQNSAPPPIDQAAHFRTLAEGKKTA